jgi:hypothetical protein
LDVALAREDAQQCRYDGVNVCVDLGLAWVGVNVGSDTHMYNTQTHCASNSLTATHIVCLFSANIALWMLPSLGRMHNNVGMMGFVLIWGWHGLVLGVIRIHTTHTCTHTASN